VTGTTRRATPMSGRRGAACRFAPAARLELPHEEEVPILLEVLTGELNRFGLIQTDIAAGEVTGMAGGW
jgi:hypothetical protein